MNIVLLCHERELPKKSNTGQLLLAQAGVNCRQVVWARKHPDLELLAAIEQKQCWLIYPLLNAVGERVTCLQESQYASREVVMPLTVNPSATFILIDATWQQAQKMYNQSPYLQQLPRVELLRERPSEFRLRKNQKSSGLCTVECAIELLRLFGEVTYATALNEKFLSFMAQPRNTIFAENEKP